MKDTAFEGSLRCRWKQLRQTTLSSQHIFSLIDSISALVNEAQQRHFQRWPILGQYVWPNPQPIPSSYNGELTSLKAWIDQRLQWIDANMPNQGACYDYPPNANKTIIVSINPNPLWGEGTMIVQSKNNQPLTMHVYDAMGRVMQAEQVQLHTGVNSISLHSNYWARGVYFVSVKASNGDKELRKLVVN